MIKQFQGEYRWLSNFWPVVVRYDGMEYPTVEHAYVAAKTIDKEAREVIALQPTPGAAKRYGRTLALREGWDEMKVDVMRDLLRQKFAHPHIADKLRATGDTHIAECNTWGDRFWGIYNGSGQNWLGRLIMEIRSEL